MTNILDLPIPPKPDYFGPDGAPPGVELMLDAYEVLDDGTRWLDSRPFIAPTVGVVHTNAASREGSLQSSLNWGRRAKNNTKPHYNLNHPKPTKTLATNRRGIANSTGLTQEVLHMVKDSSYWSYAIETADMGSIAAGAAGHRWPYDCGPFLEDSVYGEIEVPHAEIVARIFAYESVWSNHALTVPQKFQRGMSGIVTHTDPFPYPYFTTVRGKTCPGTTKIGVFYSQIVPRAQRIRHAWTSQPTPPQKEYDVYVPITNWRFDTRAFAEKRKLKAKEVVRIPRPPNVPAGAVAVHANLTYVNGYTSGHITAWSGNGPMPQSSVLNYGVWGTTGCNAVNIELADDGSFKLYTHASTHLIVDVLGYYKQA